MSKKLMEDTAHRVTHLEQDDVLALENHIENDTQRGAYRNGNEDERRLLQGEAVNLDKDNWHALEEAVQNT